MSATPSQPPLQGSRDMPGMLLTRWCAARREELLQDRLALGPEHTHAPARMMVETALVEDLRDRDHRTRLRVGSAEHDQRDAREDNGARTHDARLERHVERAIVESPPTEALPRRAQREDLRVARRVGVGLAA